MRYLLTVLAGLVAADRLAPPEPVEPDTEPPPVRVEVEPLRWRDATPAEQAMFESVWGPDAKGGR